jgi:transcriptional regulator with XRE-family HTH domain
MTYGYSSILVERNKKADRRHLGVAVGRLCIAQSIPVSDVADRLGVSRMTIYNWFMGLHEPQAAYVPALTEFLKKLK